MLTIILSSIPSSEHFASGLALTLDAADGPEEVQVVLTEPLSSALCAAEGAAGAAAELKAEAAAYSASADENTVRALKQLGQLELFEIPTFAAAGCTLPKRLSFVKKLMHNKDLTELLAASRVVLSF